MRIKFIQNVIDKIRQKDKKYIKLEFNDLQKEIINKIYQYKGKIKYIEPLNKEELKDFEGRFATKDPLGVIIKKDGIIYRTVFEKSKESFIQLYESGILQAFADYGLIPKFELTNYYIKDNPIIFKVESLNVVPPQYWTMGMLKDEAKLMLEIIEILDNFGYGLIDGHPWNTTFKNGKPIFFDFGSIVKSRDNNMAFLGIYIYNIIPLIMHQINGFWSKRIILDINNSISINPSVDFIDSIEFKTALKRIKTLRNVITISRISREKNRFILSNDIDKLFKNNIQKAHSEWEKYYGENQEGFVEERYKKVLNSIKKNTCNVNSLLDLAGNAGHFAAYLKKNTDIQNIISVDYDENAIELGRELYKDEDINFYALNCMQHPLVNISEVAKYFKSDVVTALALTHHLLLTQKYDIDYMFNVFKSYSNKYVFIEFCPLGLFSYTLSELPKIPDYYTEAWFEEHFKKHFKLIDKEVTNIAEYKGNKYNHRILFIGEI